MIVHRKLTSVDEKIGHPEESIAHSHEEYVSRFVGPVSALAIVETLYFVEPCHTRCNYPTGTQPVLRSGWDGLNPLPQTCQCPANDNQLERINIKKKA